ncbi:MAG TPA: TIGR03435 family protein [Candidatus Sulfopaludibacter sp.]|nr:TIGR03435 family protein [Candidatus Sulfopaludibacter sp.]
MRRTILGACLSIAACGAVLAQSSDNQLTFEVASIKPAEPMTGGRMMIGSRGGPGSADPGHLTYNNVSLKNLLTNAYGVRGYQITGPSWLDGERFDIVAKLPEGTTKDQVKIMLQNLLKERFGLAVHHETKDLPMYALVVGKGGSKMKESPEDPPAPAAVTGGPNDATAAKAPEPPDVGKMMGKVVMGPDGTIKLPAAMMARTGCMNMMMMSPSGPKSHLQCSKQTMSAFVDQLSNQMDKPVNDMTGLKAKYDFTLDFLPDENGMGKMPMMPAGGGAVAFAHDVERGPGSGPGRGEQAEQVAVPPLPAALQEQLGLKLEQKKGPVDIIVVDKMQKTPTEN